MKIWKKMCKGLFWLFIIALLLAPLGLIYQISSREMEQYQVPEPPQFVVTAYGTVVPAERMDVRDFVTVSGSFVSDASAYQELDDKNIGSARWEVNVGDEVQEGQVLGTCKGKEILSQYTGILLQINAYGEDPYLKVQLLDPIVLETQVSQNVLTSLRYAKELTTEEGEPVTLKYTAMIRNPDGTSRVRLQIDSDTYAYGEAVSELRLYTGYDYMNALVLPESCLYQKIAGEDEPWYVCEVTRDGVVIGERTVTRGYSDGNYVCVTGVEEGQYFDTGYKAVAGGG